MVLKESNIAPTIKRKIVIICEYFPPHVGGAEKLFYLHVKNLSQQDKYEFRVVTSDVQNSKPVEKIFKNCTVYRYKWPTLFSHPIANFSDLKTHIDWSDVVHTATYSCAIQSLVLARKVNKPCLLTVYEVLGKQWLTIASNFYSGLLFYLFERLLLLLPFSKFHAISNHTYSKLVHFVPKSKSIMIYPFVEEIHKLQLSIPRQNYFLFFGRAGKTKGLDLLIDAIIALSNIGIFYPFVLIIGNHPKGERDKIINKINQYNLKNVLVLPTQPADKLKIYIQLAKAVIVPSLTEGFGYAAYEASQFGTPVIFSDNTSLNEVVSSGLSFINGNSIDLKNVITEITSSLFQANITDFNLSDSTERWTKVYDSVLK